MKTSERFAPLVLNVNFSANGNGIPMIVGKSIVGDPDCSCGCNKGDGGGPLKQPTCSYHVWTTDNNSGCSIHTQHTDCSISNCSGDVSYHVPGHEGERYCKCRNESRIGFQDAPLGR